jgi:plastocyanin
MTKFSARPIRPWFLVGAFMTLMLVLSACGGSGGAGSSNGGNSGSGSSGTTVQINEVKTAGKPDQYMFSPASITVKKGTTVTVVNNSDEVQDIDAGDAQKAGVDKVVAIGQSGTITFNVTGTFAIESEKGAKLTVTVQ